MAPSKSIITPNRPADFAELDLRTRCIKSNKCCELISRRFAIHVVVYAKADFLEFHCSNKHSGLLVEAGIQNFLPHYSARWLAHVSFLTAIPILLSICRILYDCKGQNERNSNILEASQGRRLAVQDWPWISDGCGGILDEMVRFS